MGSVHAFPFFPVPGQAARPSPHYLGRPAVPHPLPL